MRRTIRGKALACLLTSSTTLIAACTQADPTGPGRIASTTASGSEDDPVALANRVRTLSQPAPPIAHAVAVSVPSRADLPIHVQDVSSAVGADVLLADAGSIASTSEGELIVFHRAVASRASVIVRAGRDGFEDHVFLPDASVADSIRYQVDLTEAVAGLRLVGNSLELLDREGTPRLRVRPPFVVDAAGERHNAILAVDGCRVDRNPSAPWSRSPVDPGARRCSITVSWNAAELSYPAMVDPAWSSTASMAVPRDRHTATMLGNGKVLVTGGRSTGALASAELYDPSTGTWALTGSMASARSDHAAVPLANGDVLVTGGRIAVALDSAEIYAVSSGTFATTASMTVARWGHRAVRLPSNEVLVAGGEAISGTTAAAEIFIPATSSWQAVASMTTPRSGHTLTALGGGLVLAAGGENGGALATAEVYSRTNDHWLATGSMSSPRTRHSAVTLLSGKVLIAGGANGGALSSAELYDPVAGTFSDLPPMATARESHAAVLLSSGVALVAGGMNTGPLSGSELFDPVATVWTESGSLVQARGRAPALSLGSERALLIGGSGPNGPLDSVEVFALQPNGKPCQQRGECTSRFCVDGVCCESACAMPCMACSAAAKGQGADGVCGPVLAGLDPDDDCAPQGNPPCQTPGICNGSGACATVVGQPCAATSCESETVQTNIQVCNTALQCVSSGSTDCSPYRCRNGACLLSCTSSDDCISGSACIGSHCLAPGDNGTPCTDAAQCTSGHCVDGVCCNTDCGGMCQACKASLKSSGFDGICGAAKYGLPCGATTCSNAQVTGQLCNSTGQCLSQTAACSPFAACANATACPTECAVDSDCIATHYCAPDRQCAPRLLTGQPCTGATQCKTGFCVDGVCCATSCGNGATDDCRACSVASGSNADGTCAALDGVPCATGMCQSGLCKSVPEGGSDVEDAAVEAAQDALPDGADEPHGDVVADTSADSPALEAGVDAPPEAMVTEAGPDAPVEAAVPAGEQGSPSDDSGCSCRTAPRSGEGLGWAGLAAVVGHLAGRRRRARGRGC
jgi:hypothetical protein